MAGAGAGHHGSRAATSVFAMSLAASQDAWYVLRLSLEQSRLALFGIGQSITILTFWQKADGL